MIAGSEVSQLVAQYEIASEAKESCCTYETSRTDTKGVWDQHQTLRFTMHQS